MKVHILQHIPFETIGRIGTWLESWGAEISFTRFFENSSLPELDDLDLLVIMGGPMSANDEMDYPWLNPEKEFIRNAVRWDIPVLGICLGAQLIAAALGAKVYRNPRKEIGWFPVEGLDDAPDVFHFPESSMVFHWHGETFDLPPGAIRLAKSAACANQAFQIGGRVIGLQFHLEVTAEVVGAIVKNCGGELKPAPYIQSEEELLNTLPEKYTAVNRMMDEVLEYLTRDSSNPHTAPDEYSP